MVLSTRRFRPMNFTDILDETFDLFKSNLVVLVGIAAAFYIPVYVLQGAVVGPMLANIQAGSKGAPVGDTTAMLSRYMMGQMPIGILMLLAYCVVTGAVSYAVSQRYLGEPATIGSSYSAVFKRFGALLGTLILSGIVSFAPLFVILVISGILFAAGGAIGIVAGVILCIAAVVFMVMSAVRFSFVVPSVVVEGRAHSDALRRSWNLINGYAGKVIGTSIVVSLVVSIIAGVATAAVGQLIGFVAPLTSVTAQTIIGLVNGVVAAFLNPIGSIVVVLLYYDVRIRKEGFDLQMLARDLAISSGQPVPESEPQPVDHTESPKY